MRTTILGAFGVVWGGAIIASSVLDREAFSGPTYVAGELMALAVGALLLVAGTQALVRQHHR